MFNMLVYYRLKAPRYEAVPPRSGGAMQQLKILPAVSNCQSSRVEGLQLNYYNQATTKLAFHRISNVTSKDILPMIYNWLTLSSFRCMPNYTKTCLFLYSHYTET